MSELHEVQEALGPRYRAIRELGHGGMATVYLAEDAERRVPVAVKLLRRELTAILGATRFHREIEILARLHHPGIVPLLDSCEGGARLYYVMPYVAGDSLRARLAAGGPMPLAEVAELARGIAAAIDYAHGQGVLHRDIKPGNILLDRGRALICDFGVARALEVAGPESFSTGGLVVGTPVYMSPEQATGGPGDERADVYAFACVLYEMLAGAPPYIGATAQAVLARQLGAPPRSLRVVRPDVPAGVEAALAAALDKRPEARPGRAGALAARL
jgi:eukaryotic-like serine/threonine-protein kinase